MITFRVINITKDRRSADLKSRGAALEQTFLTHSERLLAQARQDAADAAIEAAWRSRVRENVLGLHRARDDRKLPARARHQAE
jgi:hypothetical protein